MVDDVDFFGGGFGKHVQTVMSLQSQGFWRQHAMVEQGTVPLGGTLDILIWPQRPAPAARAPPTKLPKSTWAWQVP
jgi:hypothetical protein